MSILQSLNSEMTLKQLNINELQELCAEIREVIIDTVADNGGHLSSNLGAVELTVALHYVYDTEVDKIVFDVGHQSYTHKILTGRLNEIGTIRKGDGLSGFPDPNESKYDSFAVGHAGTSISAGLGYAYARDVKNDDFNVISLVGDASFLNGENLEAITSSEDKPKKFLVILNDNGMSINKNNNGLYKFISKVTITKRYSKFNAFMAKLFGKSFIGNFLRRIKKGIKRLFNANNFIDSLGLKYVGVFDGNDVKTLISILTQIKESQNPTLLHVKTVKGKGLPVAEEDSSKYHGVSKNMETSINVFSSAVSTAMQKVYEIDNNVVCITAGMRDGVGLTDFAIEHPKNFVDVGIAEEFAVTYAGGMAKGGIKPYVFIYSTFMQRSYDQIIHDVCLQNLPVVMCLDRAGVVGSDGKTHQGVFDLSYLRHIPNLTILAPKSVLEFENMLLSVVNYNYPVAIRYPNGSSSPVDDVSPFTLSFNWEVLKQGGNTVIYACGSRMVSLALKVYEKTGGKVTVVNARVVKPLDENLILKYLNYNVITLEDNVKIGGFGEGVLSTLNKFNFKGDFKQFALNDEFILHNSVENQLVSNGITLEKVIENIKL